MLLAHGPRKSFFDHDLPYTEILEFWKLGPHLPEMTDADARVHGGQTQRLPDVFDPQWVAACDERARQLCVPRRDSRLLVGYFTDNEIDFADRDYSLLRRCRHAGRHTATGRAAHAFAALSAIGCAPLRIATFRSPAKQFAGTIRTT